MLKQLLRHSAVYGFASVLSRGVQIILIPIYTRFIAPAEFGVIDIVAVLGAFVNLTVAVEISQGVARYLADAEEESDRCKFASTSVIFSVGAYSTFAVVSVVLASPLADLLFGSDRWASTLRIGIVALAVSGLFALLQDLLRWRLDPGAYLLASVAYALGNVGVGVYLVVFAGVGVAGVLWGQLAGAFAGVFIAWSRMTDFIVPSFDTRRLALMVAYSAPLVLSGVAVFANQFIDRIAVKQLLGIDSLGTYGVAARFSSALGLTTLAIQAAFTPLLYQRYQEQGTPLELARLFRFYCAVMAPAIGAIALFSPEFVTLLSGPAYREAKDVLPILAVASLLTTMYIFAPGTFLAKRTGVVAGINMVAAVVNLALNVILVPLLGIQGAALAACCAAAIAFSGFMMSSQRLYPVPHEWKKIRNAAGLALALIAIGIWLSLKQPVLPPHWLAVKLLLSGAAALLSFLYVLDHTDRESAWRWLWTARVSA